MSGAALLILAGVWVGCQVLGGNALGRLGVSGDPSPVGTAAKASNPVDAPSGGLAGMPTAAQMIAAASAAVAANSPAPPKLPPGR